MEHDYSYLSPWMVTQIRPIADHIDEIWEGWTDDIHSFGTRKDYTRSTMTTLHNLGRKYSRKTCELITDALLTYFITEGNSDMETKSGNRYGWTMPK